MNIPAEVSKDGAEHWRFMGTKHEEHFTAARGIIRHEETLEQQILAMNRRLHKQQQLREYLEFVKAEQEGPAIAAQNAAEHAAREKAASVVVAAVRGAANERNEMLTCYLCAEEVIMTAYDAHVAECRKKAENVIRKMFLNPKRDMPLPPTASVPTAPGPEVETFNAEAVSCYTGGMITCLRCKRKYPVLDILKHTGVCTGDHTELLERSQQYSKERDRSASKERTS